ncbi:MAG: sugar transferase [Pseudomonadales bacterium]
MQDALVGGLVFLAVVNLLSYIGWIDTADAWSLALFSPVALLANAIAGNVATPGIHGVSIGQQVVRTIQHVAIAIAICVFIAYLGRMDFVGRVLVVVYSSALGLVLLINRLFLYWWYLHGRKEDQANFLKVLVVGSGARAERLISDYREHSEWGIEVVGLLDPDPLRHGQVIAGVEVLGGIDSVHDLLGQEVIDEVVVSLPRGRIDQVQSVVDACQEQAVCLKFMADIYDMKTERISLETLGEMPLLRFEPVAQDETKLVIKRIVDLLIALAAMPVLLPFFGLVALAIKLESAGPVFFRQERVGLNKRPFKMIKFRSMVTDAEERLKEIEHLNEAEGPIFKMENDPRVTKVGNFIRRTSIDELPQILNVLLGQMSLIGPRPMSMRDVDLFSKGVQRRRFSVRPGLLCLREVSGRSELSFERWLELDLQYIETWSLWLDVKILMRAIPAVLKGSGAS